MAFQTAPGEQYTIRRKVFKIFGAGFHVYTADGQIVGYCKQKAFKLKEDLRVYTNESLEHEHIRIGARNIIDFGATYDVKLPSGDVIGSFRRKGMKSLLRDTWLIFDADGKQIGRLHEDSTSMALARRILSDWSFLLPSKFSLETEDGTLIATYRTHFNVFIYRLGVAIHADDEELDDLIVLAGGFLIAAIEGRQ